MSTMPSPPEGYSCDYPGYDNVPDDPIVNKAPMQPVTPGPALQDARVQTSNTQRVPFGGPVMPKGI